MTPLTYLAVDSVRTGPGVTQVLPYVNEIARLGRHVELHTFEPEPGEPGLPLADGIDWHAHPFGSLGSRGGAARMMKMAQLTRGRPLLHARGNTAGTAAAIGRPVRWVWDMRAFWRAQRIALGSMRHGSAEHRILGRLEHTAGRTADHIIVLNHASRAVLEERHGSEVVGRTSTIPTCVDLSRFTMDGSPGTSPVQALLQGSINRLYDVPLMLAFVDELRALRPTELRVVRPDPGVWEDQLQAAADVVERRAPAEMPEAVRHSSLGLCVLAPGNPLSSAGVYPTKAAEFLASGRPVVVDANAGDVAVDVLAARAGVVVDGPDSLGLAAQRLIELLDDPQLPARCRDLAERRFDVRAAAKALHEIYTGIEESDVESLSSMA
ncbi:MAG: hypothetical protein S0880_19010 [Actinomycetota bacterium]|nr:hypothetical protein [Actinomycetota bacterium]